MKLRFLSFSAVSISLLLAVFSACSYLGQFSITNAMKTDVTVNISINEMYESDFRRPNEYNQVTLCLFEGEKLDCADNRKILYFSDLYQENLKTFRVVIPPGHSLLLERTSNFFGLFNQNEIDRLSIINKITLLSLETREGKIVYSGLEIYKAFPQIKRRWWDLRLTELFEQKS